LALGALRKEVETGEETLSLCVGQLVLPSLRGPRCQNPRWGTYKTLQNECRGRNGAMTPDPDQLVPRDLSLGSDD
jgi:hypothetical protein